MKKLALALFMFIVVAPTQAAANSPMDFLVHTYNMTITVNCMDKTLRNMSTLPGFELSSRIYIVEGRGEAVRMVSARDLPATLLLLASMGEITQSQSFATNVFSNWARLTSEISVRNHEYVRLMELLYEAETMDAFRRIERRLQTVIGDIEAQRGELNYVENTMGSAHITIQLVQYVPQEQKCEPEQEEEELSGNFHQISNAFFASIHGTGIGVQAVLMFLAHISIPTILLIVVAVIIHQTYKKRKQQPKQDNDTGNNTPEQEAES